MSFSCKLGLGLPPLYSLLGKRTMPDNTDRKKQIRSALTHFYDNPVAKVSLELFLSIGLVVFLAIFAIKPTLLTMTDLISEIEDKKDLNEQLEKKIAALSTAQNEYLQVEPKLSLLDQAIPQEPELIRTLKLIEKLATEHSVVIDGIAIAEIPAEESGAIVDNSQKQLTSSPMSISLAGDYLSIRNFSQALQDNRRTFSIESVTFSMDQDRDIKELRATLHLNVPYFGAVKATGRQNPAGNLGTELE